MRSIEKPLDRKHFLEERCTGGAHRWPWTSTAFSIVAVATHYSMHDKDAAYTYGYRGAMAPWFTPWTYAFIHFDSMHLWSNLLVVLVAGAMLEATDGSARMLIVLVASIPMAAVGHGAFSDRFVVGASGYAYAILTYQIALLLKNWREMRVRAAHPDPWIAWRSYLSSARARLALLVALLVLEVAFSQTTDDLSSGGHLFGALVGVFAGISIASNVTVDVCEFLLPPLGLCGYLALVLAGFATLQVAAASFACIAIPFIGVYTTLELMRWRRKWRVVTRGNIWRIERRAPRFRIRVGPSR